MRFDSLEEVLTFAIRKEHNARELYLMFRDMVKDPGAKALLEDLAKQELGHKNLLEHALKGDNVERIGGKSEIQDLRISDHTVAEEVGPDSSPQDVMLLAMKMERAAHELYSVMLENYRGTELEGIFSQLVREELRHKEILEREYEEHFMMWM